MRIPDSLLDRDVLVLDVSSGSFAVPRIPAGPERPKWVVLVLAGQSYAVLTADEAGAWISRQRPPKVVDVPGATAAVERNVTSLGQVRRIAAGQPGRPVVVLSLGKVLGVFDPGGSGGTILQRVTVDGGKRDIVTVLREKPRVVIQRRNPAGPRLKSLGGKQNVRVVRTKLGPAIGGGRVSTGSSYGSGSFGGGWSGGGGLGGVSFGDSIDLLGDASDSGEREESPAAPPDDHGAEASKEESAPPHTLDADAAPVPPPASAPQHAPPAPPVPEPEPPPPERFFNAEFEDHPAGAPLEAGESYVLAIDVDERVREGSIAGAVRFAEGAFNEGEDEVVLTLTLQSDDAEVHSPPQPLRVRRRGRSLEKARFGLVPRRGGEAVLSVVVTRDGNFLKLLTFRVAVGGAAPAALAAPEAKERPLDAAFRLEPRDLTLLVERTAAGYALRMVGAVQASATLPLTPQQLEAMVADTRQAMHDVVHMAGAEGVGLPHQDGIDVPAEVAAEALGRLAKAGFRLYQKIFFGPGADQQARQLGTYLRTVSERGSLRVQVCAEHFPIPWALLYLAEKWDPAAVDAERFLGFRHVIEQIPLQPQMHVADGAIDTRSGLTVSLNLNADIDAEMGLPLIAEQVAWWEGVRGKAGVTVVRRGRAAELQAALGEAGCPDHLLYFYCHAVSRSLAESGGPDQSALVLGGGGRVSLEDLSLATPLDAPPLPGAPLVFLNACQSAELSPLFYDGFVPFFMARGARGALGTECDTPAVFAAEWARRFFERFLGGEPLGSAVLALRREFLLKHRNAMGLLYAVHCDGDTRVDPGLVLS